MQSAAVFVALLAAASANTAIFRTPSHDSASITSSQQGGNFAYQVAESPAFGVVSPVVSHVAQPVATTYAVQQPSTWTVPTHTSTIVAGSTPVVSEVKTNIPVVTTNNVATTYAVQQPSTWTVPTHTSTIVAGSTPVVSEVKTTVPVVTTGNVATTYGATAWPYASAFTYGNTVVDSSSPIIYSAKTNLVGVETEKQINQVHHTAPAAVTYTAVQQPTATVVSSGTPVTWSNVHQQQLVSTSGTPVTWSSVQQPANSIVSSGTQWGSSVVSSPIAATTYSVPSTSVISTGTPAATFKTISTGVSPIGINQWNNQWGYGYGQPWGTWNQQVVV